MPGAADAGLAFEDREVVPAGALQPDARAEPAEAGADDEHVVMLHEPSRMGLSE